MVQHYSIDRIRRERQAIGCNDHAFFDHTIDLSGMNGSVQARFHHASFTRSFSYHSPRPEPEHDFTMKPSCLMTEHFDFNIRKGDRDLRVQPSDERVRRPSSWL
jgi:hypothetical protein